MEEKKDLLYYVGYTEGEISGIAPNPKIYQFRSIITGEFVNILVHRVSRAIGACYNTCANYFEDISDIAYNYNVIWKRENKDIYPIVISFEDVQLAYQRIFNENQNDQDLAVKLLYRSITTAIKS